MILMHGTFDLVDGIQAAEFSDVYARFAEHMQEQGYVEACRCMQHQPHDGYNSNAPDAKYYVSMEFPDMDHAQRCWDYIEEMSQPAKALHTAVFSKIENYSFFLTSDI